MSIKIVSLLIFLLAFNQAFTQGAGNALNFDGWSGSEGEYVDFGSASELRITGDLTIEAWVYLTAEPASGQYSLLTYGNHRSGSEVEADNLLYWPFIDSNSNIAARHEYGAGQDVTTVVANVSMLYGRWIHLTIYRTDGYYAFLRNGGREGGGYYVYEPTGGSDGIAVLGGSFAASGTPDVPDTVTYLDGYVDEVRIWNAAVDFWDVRDWMNRKLGGTHPNIGSLVGYWKLDDNISSSTAVDQTGNNNGTLKNMETGSGGDRILSTAPIGDASIYAIESDLTDPTTEADITGNEEVSINVTFGEDEEGTGMYYPLAVMQVNDAPNSTSGLLTFYPNTYWELWAQTPTFDGNFTATVQFNYDYLGGIGDETTLSLYRRNDVNGSWSFLSSSPVTGGSTTDGIGYFEITITEGTSGGFSGQYIVTSSDTDNPLPVELATFTVNLVDDAVKLEWVTHSEVNNQGFEIWRDIDQQEDFQLIASYRNHRNLVGAGNSSTARHYQYLDKNILPGHEYAYQLWEVSYAGERNSYGPVSLNLNDTENISEQYVLFQNYPNPFNPITYIRFQIHQLDFQGGKAVPVNLDVYDLLGKKIKSLINSDLNVGDYTHSWDGTDDSGKRVASGTYIYQLKLGDQLTSKKLMLIR